MSASGSCSAPPADQPGNSWQHQQQRVSLALHQLEQSSAQPRTPPPPASTPCSGCSYNSSSRWQARCSCCVPSSGSSSWCACWCGSRLCWTCCCCCSSCLAWLSNSNSSICRSRHEAAVLCQTCRLMLTMVLMLQACGVVRSCSAGQTPGSGVGLLLRTLCKAPTGCSSRRLSGRREAR